MNRPELRARDLLAVLNRHQVDYVVIGAFAALSQGAPLEATHDVDVTPRRDAENLRRLSEALTELDAHVRGTTSTKVLSSPMTLRRWPP